MTSVSFYQLEKTPLDKALAKLLEKVLQQGYRALVKAGSEARVEFLSTALWTYERESFLPHGSSNDGWDEVQPIYLTSSDKNPNGADVLVLIDGVAYKDLEGFQRIVEIFEAGRGSKPQVVRERWQFHKNKGYNLTYWQETEQNGWKKSSFISNSNPL